MSQILVPSRRIWTRQPQAEVPLLPWVASALTPVMAREDQSSDGNFRVLRGSDWTCQGYLNSSVSSCKAGKSVLTNGNAYLQRTIAMSGPLTVAIVFVATSSGATRGIWSIGSTLTDGSPQILIQQNGADIRVYCSGGYQMTFAGAAPIGAVCNILLSIDTLSATGSVLRMAVNGRVQSYSGGVRATGESTEYLMAGYSSAAEGHFCLYWSAQTLMSVGELAALSANPWQVFQPRRRVAFFDMGAGGFGLAAQASGAGQSSGTADLHAQVALAGVGVSLASGQTTPSVAIPLSAAGISVSGGSANGIATVSLSAAGLAQAAGQAGLSASVLLAAAGAAKAAGNTALAALLNAQAAGAGQAGGSANLTGGAPGALSASGGDVASGSAVLSVSVKLQATGAAQAGGSANGAASAPGQIAASGGSQSGGQATVSATVTLTAAGFVQAMGAGQFTVQVPLRAVGQAISTGQAVMTSTGLMVSAPSGCASYQNVRHPALQAGFRGFNASGFRAPNVGGRRISR